jgi:teichuronic acid biosynthesis glycosyltransferase TuaC
MPPERRVRQRVLVLTGIFPNRRNETWGIHVFQNVRALSAHADVRVIAPVPWIPRWLARGRYRACVGVPRRDDWSGIPASYPRFFLVPKVGRFLHGYQLFLSVLGDVRREVRVFRPDVLLAYFAFPYGFAASRFGALFRIPVVISCRGGDINYMTKPKLQGALIARSLRSARGVWVMSEEMRHEATALGVSPDRVEVMPNGVDGTVFAPRDPQEARSSLGIPGSGRVVVCVSRLSHEKGIDVLVDAFAMLADGEVRLYVVGDGSERASLAARTRSAGCEDRITFVGTRPHAEVPQWLAAADVVVLPSRSEGMPNAVLEALASGRPVVASAVGGTRELIGADEVGTLVPPDDAASLAPALRDALAASWDARSIAASVASRRWDDVARRKARALELAVAGKASTPAQPATESNTWHAGKR